MKIDRSLLADDPEMAEDLVAAAVNDAVNKVSSLVESTMGEATRGMPLPPGMKIPGLFTRRRPAFPCPQPHPCHDLAPA